MRGMRREEGREENREGWRELVRKSRRESSEPVFIYYTFQRKEGQS